LEPKCGGTGGEGYWVSANEYSCAHGAQLNSGDLTPYLTYIDEIRRQKNLRFALLSL
jgi:hypothetical protein